MVTYLGLLVQLCCGERETLQTNTTGVCGECLQCWTPMGLPLLTACVLSRCTLFRLQVALQGNCLKRALGCVHFPGLSHSGSHSRVVHKGTDLVWPVFCALPRSEQVTKCLASTLTPGGPCVLSPLWSQLLSFLGVQWDHSLRCAMCLSEELDLWLRPSWQMSTI